MKRFVSILVLACFVAVFGFAQETTTGKKEEKQVEKKEAVKSESKWHGYVVDAMCAKGMMKKDNPMEKAAKHTKDCALDDACAASGYGVFSDGKFYKFDETGDKKAKAVIEKSGTEKGMMVDVTGTIEGDKIMVASIAEMKMDKKATGKKAGDMKKVEKKVEQKD